MKLYIPNKYLKVSNNYLNHIQETEHLLGERKNGLNFLCSSCSKIPSPSPRD